MTTQQIVNEIDNQVAKLQQARALLAGVGAGLAGSGVTPSAVSKKRTTSVETRAKMAAAQKARWAKK